ncbi:hypothetical protein BDV96DRAFT_602241 [Lophiotrema nucula]|uniref:Uncharacterized protein n=1 Tax=Lophiotrema nucula TaxID=690887 RepID=A0A6A5YZT0_9PLEO|nr:hypothetical protein BDV96DRAFT_602241 [Lophiotrema nucula]
MAIRRIGPQAVKALRVVRQLQNLVSSMIWVPTASAMSYIPLGVAVVVLLPPEGLRHPPPYPSPSYGGSTRGAIGAKFERGLSTGGVVGEYCSWKAQFTGSLACDISAVRGRNEVRRTMLRMLKPVSSSYKRAQEDMRVLWAGVDGKGPPTVWEENFGSGVTATRTSFTTGVRRPQSPPPAVRDPQQTDAELQQHDSEHQTSKTSFSSAYSPPIIPYRISSTSPAYALALPALEMPALRRQQAHACIRTAEAAQDDLQQNEKPAGIMGKLARIVKHKVKQMLRGLLRRQQTQG